MSKFEQLLDNILDCVTESVEDGVIETEPTVVDSITESVINGDISVDECKLLLESVEDTEYHISILDRFTEGVIDNDECIVLLEATRYEKEHTKALQELRKQNEETENKIKALEKLIKTTSNRLIAEKLSKQIKKLKDDLSSSKDKYYSYYRKADGMKIDPSSPSDKTRLELGTQKDHNDYIKNAGRTIKNNERNSGFNTPSTKVREPGLYLKAHQGK